MRIITPSFTVIDAPTYEAALHTVEQHTRRAYRSEDLTAPGSAERLIRKILAQKPRPHLSVLEHVHFSVEFTFDRGLSHEIVRHRHTAFTQESSRYCNYSKGKFGGEVTLCPMMAGLALAQFERRLTLFSEAERVYLAELAEGVKPEQARDVLPTCLATRIGVTANFAEWRHILTVRTHRTAHPAMRAVMRRVLTWAKGRYPVFFEGVGYESDEMGAT